MARDYARIMTAIWRNKEFRALDEAPQRGYLLLVTQPDISAAGVLALRLRRWADMSTNSTVEGLAQVLKVLETGRFIVVDRDAEELLIRSFIRWDGGFNNPKRTPAIIGAAAEVESELIRRHLVAEFQRCGISTTPDTPPDGPSGSHADSLSSGPSQGTPVDLGPDPFPQVNSLSDTLFQDTLPAAGTTDASALVPEERPRRSIAYPVAMPIARGNTTTHNPQPATLKSKRSKTTSGTAPRSRPDVDQLCELLHAQLSANGVQATIGEQWRTAARLLLDRDRRPLAEALRLITWSTAHHFWSTNVLSMPTFRKQYDKLRLQEKSEPGPRHLKSISATELPDDDYRRWVQY